MIIDIVMLVILGIVTWCVAGEGAFGAASNCVIVIIAGLLAMNFFEPAAVVGQKIIGGGAWPVRWDVIALVGLFTFFVLGLRFVLERVAPRYHHMQGTANEVGRWLFGLICGYMTIAFLMTALHTAPFPRNFADFEPEDNNFFGLAPDRQWLGFTQFTSETLFTKGSGRMFDGPVSDFIQGPATEAKNTVWPSFPIRYAQRREQFSGGALAAGGGAPQQQQQPSVQPAQPTGGGTGGF